MKSLPALWARRAAGGVAACDRCSGALLLSVGALSYRWRCRTCGHASERFDIRADGRARVVTNHDPAFARESFVGTRVRGLLAERVLSAGRR